MLEKFIKFHAACRSILTLLSLKDFCVSLSKFVITCFMT
ncbi:hypothetical protein A1OE_809 [Candidatus Endolissoclinum faulkneri L2]|uniref:Uncharacterized protein n=1 Tax=Candidatus Endolissoclinum faulkneri L2 TaxID=1193729 RepID=K7YR46_9PROT|nr:hypothetical protein A1OE_809 [Candidatus Endolissoclinum faulkneri L2]